MPCELGQVPRRAVVARQDDLGLADGLEVMAQGLVVLAGTTGRGEVLGRVVRLRGRVPLHQRRTPLAAAQA